MISVGTARKIIRMFPKPIERSLRNALWAIWPVTHRSRYPVAFHCCSWKTASQWIKAILSDPRVYQKCGLRARHMSWFGKGTKLGSLKTDALETGYIYTPVYESYQSIKPHLDKNNGRAFFVLRDPRDQLVSHYFSLLSAHPVTSGVQVKREWFTGLSKEEGLIRTLSDFVTITDIVEDWLMHGSKDHRVKILRFEDLTGPNQAQAWADLFAHLDIEVTPQALVKILRYYSFENITGGRKKGAEDTTHKYRKGEAGDWVNHFTPNVQSELEERFGNIVQRWGYS